MGKTAQVCFNRAKQLNRRRQNTVSMHGKRSQANLKRNPKSYLFTDALVYNIAHWPVPPKLDSLIFGDNFLLTILANCVRDESCGEKLAPNSPRGPKFVAQTDLCVHR